MNCLRPNISMHILHTVLYTFPTVLSKRIELRSRASLIGDRFLYSCGLKICEITPSANHWLQNVKSVLTYLLRGMGHRTWYLVFLPFFFLSSFFNLTLLLCSTKSTLNFLFPTRINRVTVSDELRILSYIFGQLYTVYIY